MRTGLLFHGCLTNTLPSRMLKIVRYTAYLLPLWKLKDFIIICKDYPTKDGTFIRDYIHVTDIEQGNVFALNLFERKNENIFKENCVIYNMGTNKGYSDKEVTEIYEKENEIKLNYKYRNKRKGDASIAIPVCNKIYRELD